MRFPLPWLAALALTGCAAPSPPPPRPAAPPAAASARFFEDDFGGAVARARAEGKALFVDAWAPWCHTCLSMKRYVLGDPALGALADRVVFLAVDTDRPEAAAFQERFAPKALPTFYVLDPASLAVVGHWEGSASVAEMRGFVEESLALMRGGAMDPASRAHAEARVAHAGGKLAEAAAAYERAVAAAPPSWASRGAALNGWIAALAGAKAWEACARVGRAHLAEVRGSAAPADFAAVLLSCAGELPAGPEQRAAREAAVARLRELAAHPPADASVDDRQDALGTLAEGLADLGDKQGSRAVEEARLALLDAAAKAARSPEEAHTYDYARANVYEALGRADEAAAMLAQREKEMPDAYEPPARLAGVLLRAGKLAEAKAAAERAIARAYGPRRLRYVAVKAQILGKMGDKAGALGALREEVRGWEALPKGQASPEKIADARRRLAEAEAAQ
jgi:thiol-disulfide isomerase/thioredoxin